MKTIASLLSAALLLGFAAHSQAQDTAKMIDDGVGVATFQHVDDIRRYTDILAGRHEVPEFFTKEYPSGSPYLTKEWMRGIVELSPFQVIPHPQEVLLFNFDKMTNRVMTITPEGKTKSYSINTVGRFTLVDSNGRTYSFEKVPAISSYFFLMPLVKTENGYSLYKRVITKMKQADFQNIGYNSTGKRYDSYLDEYEYFLLPPGGGKAEKFFLTRQHLARVFKDHSDKLNAVDRKYDHKISEEALVELVEAINVAK